jgi:copper chaperone NosL
MKKLPALLLLASCLLMAAVFVVPIWQINLDAPQYPGGLAMYIWVNQITGTDEFTLQNINILNHYIGMAPIHPDSFVELKIMPYVVAAFIATGLLVLMLRNRIVLATWTTLLVIAATVGLADFYIWQQAFGNNLDPQAPIKIEGMTYSPPFLGVRTILNITASSYPHLGGVAFGLAVLAALVATYAAFKKTAQQKVLA